MNTKDNMCYQEKDEEYDTYRNEYIKNISEQVFPWGPAYYYYLQNIDRIDVMSIDDFIDEMLSISNKYGDETTAFEAVSAPVYTTLDHYYNLGQLIDKQNNVIQLL